MKNLKIISFILLIFFSYKNVLVADTPFFLDFKYILNESDAGKKAQNFLKNKLNKGIKSIQDKEKKYKKKKKIISQKKVISAEEYKKKGNRIKIKGILFTKRKKPTSRFSF